MADKPNEEKIIKASTPRSKNYVLDLEDKFVKKLVLCNK